MTLKVSTATGTGYAVACLFWRQVGFHVLRKPDDELRPKLGAVYDRIAALLQNGCNKVNMKTGTLGDFKFRLDLSFRL